MRCAVLLAPLVLLLASCSSAPEPAAAPTPDEVFTRYLVDEQIAANQQGAELYIDVADGICAAHDGGSDTATIIATLLQSGGDLSSYQVGQLHGVAVAAYCPEYGE